MLIYFIKNICYVFYKYLLFTNDTHQRNGVNTSFYELDLYLNIVLQQSFLKALFSSRQLMKNLTY